MTTVSIAEKTVALKWESLTAKNQKLYTFIMRFLSTEEEFLFNLELVESFEHPIGSGGHLREMFRGQDLVLIRAKMNTSEHITRSSVLSKEFVLPWYCYTRSDVFLLLEYRARMTLSLPSLFDTQYSLKEIQPGHQFCGTLPSQWRILWPFLLVWNFRWILLQSEREAPWWLSQWSGSSPTIVRTNWPNCEYDAHRMSLCQFVTPPRSLLSDEIPRASQSHPSAQAGYTPPRCFSFTRNFNLIISLINWSFFFWFVDILAGRSDEWEQNSGQWEDQRT